jgi:hypothetical protein
MHLFYRCHQIKQVSDELKHIFNIIFEKNIVLVEENVIIEIYILNRQYYANISIGLDNALFTFNRVQYIPIDIQLNFFQ